MDDFKPVPLPSGNYSDDARSFVAQDLLNLIRVNAEQPGTRNDYQLKSVPGLLPFSARADISRQRGGYVCEGRLLCVMDQTLFQVATDGTLETLGTIPGNSRCSFSHNQITNGNEVLITNGTQGFIYNTVSGDLTQITDEGFMGGLLSAFIGARFITLDPARRFFQNSELADGLNWNSSEFYAGESSPDRIRSIAVLNNEVVLLNESTTEHFAYTGTTNALFENKGIAIGRGCASTHAVSVMDNAVFLIGNDGSGYEKRGYEMRRITHAIEQAWAKNDLSKAFSFTWEDKGHKVWYVTFPVGEEAGTWGFDVATRSWHRRESYGMHRWRLAWCVQWNGDWYGGEYNGGRIFKLDWAYPLEGSDCLSREFSPGVMHDNGNRVTLNAVRLNVEAGPSVEAVEVTEQAPVIEVLDLQGGGGIRWVAFNTADNSIEQLAAETTGMFTGKYYQSRPFLMGDFAVVAFESAPDETCIGWYENVGAGLTERETLTNAAGRTLVAMEKLSESRLIALYEIDADSSLEADLVNWDGADATVVDNLPIVGDHGVPDYLQSCVVGGKAVFLCSGNLSDRFLFVTATGDVLSHAFSTTGPSSGFGSGLAAIGSTISTGKGLIFTVSGTEVTNVQATAGGTDFVTADDTRFFYGDVGATNAWRLSASPYTKTSIADAFKSTPGAGGDYVFVPCDDQSSGVTVGGVYQFDGAAYVSIRSYQINTPGVGDIGDIGNLMSTVVRIR